MRKIDHCYARLNHNIFGAGSNQLNSWCCGRVFGTEVQTLRQGGVRGGVGTAGQTSHCDREWWQVWDIGTLVAVEWE